MSWRLVARWSVPAVVGEVQLIEGPDGSAWVRLERDHDLVAVWSAERQGAGVVSTDRVVIALAHAVTSDDVRAVTDHMKFLGWEFWPGVPAPLRDYLFGEFDSERGEVSAQPAY